MVTVTSMIAWVILFPIARVMRKREMARAAAAELKQGTIPPGNRSWPRTRGKPT